MKNVTIFNNSPGVLSVRITKAGKSTTGAITSYCQLGSYEETGKCLDVDLEIGDTIIIENDEDFSP